MKFHIMKLKVSFKLPPDSFFALEDQYKWNIYLLFVSLYLKTILT